MEESGISVIEKSPTKVPVSHDKKRALFARSANIMTKRGYKVVNEVPEFYYVTDKIMVCPPLDGLHASEIWSNDPEYDSELKKMPFAQKLKAMVPGESEFDSARSAVLTKVAGYMNKKHAANYNVYNLYRDRQLDHAANLFHQVTEYPFPKANMVMNSPISGFMSLSTPPPTLRQLFLIVLEMASWINFDDEEQNVVLLH